MGSFFIGSYRNIFRSGEFLLNSEERSSYSPKFESVSCKIIKREEMEWAKLETKFPIQARGFIRESYGYVLGPNGFDLGVFD